MITVIITIYNREKTLERAIESFLSQDYQDKYLILIDDGSEDKSAKICEKYLSLNNISYFYQDNKGAAAAKNTGVSLAKSEYITFLDSDDYFNHASVLSYIKREILSCEDDVDFISFSSVIIKTKTSETIDEYDMRDIEEDGIKYHMLKSPLNYAAHHPYTFKKEKFISAGMLDETAKWGDAVLFWRRFFNQNVICKFIKDTGYVYDQSDDFSVSRSNDKTKKIMVYSVILKSYQELGEQVEGIKYNKVWELILLVKAIDTGTFKLILSSLVRWCYGNPLSVLKSLLYVFKTKVLK